MVQSRVTPFSIGMLVLAIGWMASPCAVQAQDAAPPSPPAADAGNVQYLPLDAPAGMSQAVVVENKALVHTRQLFPVDQAGNLVGADTLEKQIEQVLTNLDTVLQAAGSGLNQLVRVHVYAIEPATVEQVRDQLSKRLDPAVRPAITSVLTPMPNREARVAIDAIAVTHDAAPAVVLQRCEAVHGDADCADTAVMPAGGVAYLSGVPAEGGLTTSAIDKSMLTLGRTLEQLQLTSAHIVQLKVFLKPATSAEETLQALKKFFPGQLTPPVVFVEWIAQAPVEIELIAQLPPQADPAAKSVRYYNAPEFRPLPTFSRVALVQGACSIYTSSLFSREGGRGEEQANDVFAQLQSILEQAGSDMQHLAKATYYVSDDDAGRGFDRVRLRYFDPQRPPAASKVMVYGMGKTGRSLTMDMIAVGVAK